MENSVNSTVLIGFASTVAISETSSSFLDATTLLQGCFKNSLPLYE